MADRPRDLVHLVLAGVRDHGDDLLREAGDLQRGGLKGDDVRVGVSTAVTATEAAPGGASR